MGDQKPNQGGWGQNQVKAVTLALIPTPHYHKRKNKQNMQQTKQILAFMLEFLSTLIKLHIWKIANSINWKITRAQILA